MNSHFVRGSRTWLSYLMIAFYGYYLNILGPITPFLKNELSLSYTISSLHFTLFALGILLVGFAGHFLIRRIGHWKALWLGAFGMSLGALLLIAGRSSLVTIAGCFVMGVIGSLILAVVPSALSEVHQEQRAVALSEANTLASLIAAFCPLIVGWAAAMAGGWRLALGTAAVVPLLMFLVFGRGSASAKTTQTTAPGSGSRLPARYWLFWTALFLGVAVEFCMVFWSADYLENSLGMARVSAAQAVSLFFAGMILGRLAMSRLVERFPAVNLVVACILIASVGFLAYWLGGSIFLGVIGLFITGLGVAGLYPLILSLAIGASEGNTGQAGARATLASGAAILALPLVLGRLADAIQIKPAYGLVAVLLLGLSVIVFSAGKRINAVKEESC